MRVSCRSALSLSLSFCKAKGKNHWQQRLCHGDIQYVNAERGQDLHVEYLSSHINEFDYDVTDDSGDSQLMSSMSVKKNGNAEVDDTNPKLDRK